MTRLPRRASAVAALDPPGPPPTTATSKSHFDSSDELFDRWSIRVQDGEERRTTCVALTYPTTRKTRNPLVTGSLQHETVNGPAPLRCVRRARACPRFRDAPPA